MQKPQWNRIKDLVQRKELSLAMGLHLGAIFLCGLIYILLPEDVHLRWGLTYVLIWTALLSPIALMIAARKSERKLVIRLYSGVIGIGIWLLTIFLQVIGGDIFFPPTCFCKDGDYLARRYRYDFFDNNMTAIYKVSGLTERRVTFYSYSNPDSIKVYESLNVIALYCPSEIQEDPLPSDTIAPLRVIEQLYDDTMEPERKKIEQLAHQLNARLGYTLTGKQEY